MKCKLCKKAAVTEFEIGNNLEDWFGVRKVVAEFGLCDSHNWLQANVSRAIKKLRKLPAGDYELRYITKLVDGMTLHTIPSGKKPDMQIMPES